MKNEDFKNLMQGVKELKAYKKGALKPSRVFDTSINPLEIRNSLKMSQSEFASFLDVSLKTVQNWEQHRSIPTGAARSLLKVVLKRPKAVMEALHI